jgi:hypothetical protein
LRLRPSPPALLAGLLLLAALAAPAHASSDPDAPDASLQAASFEWSSPGSAAGPLVVLAAVGGSEAPPTLTVAAARLDLSWDQSNAYVAAGDTWLSLFPTRDEAHYDNAELSVAAARDGWVAYVLPAGPATASVDCGAVAAAQESSRSAPVVVDRNRPAPTADTSRAVEVRPSGSCPAPTVHVRGDLDLVLWELDGGIHADRSATFRSGHYSDTGARQYFVTATGADLLFRAAPDASSALYAGALDVAADALVAHQASGAVAGVGVEAPSAILRGAGLTAHAERDGAGLRLTAWHASSMEVDGAAVHLASSPSPSPWRASWWALAALPAVTAAGVARRRALDPERLRQRIEVAGERGEHGRVAALATRLLRRLPDDAVGLAGRAEARLALGNAAGARSDALRLLRRPLDPEARAALSIVACRACAWLGKADEALQFLGDAYAEHPPTARSATGLFPEVARLAGDPSYS